MAGDAIITIIGNLTAAPKIRSTSNGGRVANVTIASTPRQFNRTSGQWEDGDALFMRCSAWDTQHQPLASNMQASLTKGHEGDCPGPSGAELLPGPQWQQPCVRGAVPGRDWPGPDSERRPGDSEQ